MFNLDSFVFIEGYNIVIKKYFKANEIFIFYQLFKRMLI